MVKCLRLTDKEKSKTFLISLGCVTVPMVLISRTLSSCKSAFLNSCIMASSVLASQFLRTVLYTADLKSAGIVASPLQWASNLLWASVIVAEWPLRPRTPRTIPRKRASRWPKRTFRRKFCPKVVRTFPENCRIAELFRSFRDLMTRLSWNWTRIYLFSFSDNDVMRSPKCRNIISLVFITYS